MAPNLSDLPGEVLLHIMSFLEAPDVVSLQLVSTQMLRVGRDNSAWRLRSFESSLAETRRRRRLRIAASAGPDARESCRERMRTMAHWDMALAGEDVSWYSEYVQRNAQLSTNWLQQPRRGGLSNKDAAVEVRGVALYEPDGPGVAADGLSDLLAVAPLADGSVCLWDVNGTRGQRGAIVARSAPCLLFSRDSAEEITATECVSVDSHRHLGFFAVRNCLVEVDLRRLEVVHTERYPWAVTALSTSHPAVPLSIGLTRGLSLRDTRTSGCTAAVELAGRPYTPSNAPHPEPGPLSILHLQQPGSGGQLSDDLYTAGRLPIILHYDRRNLSNVKGTIHSGASLCGLTSLPSGPRESGSRTIVACGEYKSKGALELYDVAPAPRSRDGPKSAVKNRITSSHSKILSVANHGTRLVFSDGAGQIKWFERDGITEVRSCQLEGRKGDGEPRSSLFGTRGSASAGDIARKLLPGTASGTGGLLGRDVLFWTGERLGQVSFSAAPGFTAADFESDARSEQEAAAEEQERAYGARMRRLLENQANDVRFVRYLGLGF